MSSAYVIEKPHPADEAGVMHMAIKRLAGDYRDRCRVGIICGWRNDNDGTRVMAKLRIGIIVVTIVERIVRPGRQRRTPVPVNVIAWRAADKRTADLSAGQCATGTPCFKLPGKRQHQN